MKAIMMFLAVALCVSSLAPAEAKEVVIKDYPLGQFAIKGEVQNKLDSLVDQIRKDQKPSPFFNLGISIVGSADVTGKSVANDVLAKNRAGQAKAFLASHFPEARINAWSKGDWENIRQIRISYSYEFNFVGLALFALPISLIALLVFLQVILTRPKTSPQPQPTERMVVVNVGGKTYSVPLHFKEGYWWTPFYNSEGTISAARRNTFQQAKKAVKFALENPRYANQVKDLEKTGIIIVKDTQTPHRKEAV